MIKSYYYKTYKNVLKNLKTKSLKYKPLIAGLLKNTGGRNNCGKITSYHRGGGVKKLYRKISNSYFELLKQRIYRWIVERIEYDPNRTSNIVLLKANYFPIYNKRKCRGLYFMSNFYSTVYAYKLASESLKKGDLVSFFNAEQQDVAFENQYSRLKNVETGSNIFNIELVPLTKGKLVRAAGCKAKFLRKYRKYGLIILPSKKRKLIKLKCFVTVGKLSNAWRTFLRYYKAGNSRWRNIRPRVRGVAMNPVDHPHGGGEGKTSGGRHSVSKWGKLTKGFVTKRKKQKKIIKYV